MHVAHDQYGKHRTQAKEALKVTDELAFETSLISRVESFDDWSDKV